MKITSSNLIRFCRSGARSRGHRLRGHSADSSARRRRVSHHDAWAIITSLKFAMCRPLRGRHHGAVCTAGGKGRRVRTRWRSSCWQLSWTLLTCFVFAEAFILPPLAATAPAFVDAVLGISYGHTGDVNLGALPTLYSRRRDHLHAWRPAVWHRDVPRRDPAARAGGSARHRRHADSTGGAAPARGTAVRGRSGGVCSGLAGLCALLRAASISRSGGAWRQRARSSVLRRPGKSPHNGPGAGERSCRSNSQISGTCRFGSAGWLAPLGLLLLGMLP